MLRVTEKSGKRWDHGGIEQLKKLTVGVNWRYVNKIEFNQFACVLLTCSPYHLGLGMVPVAS